LDARRQLAQAARLRIRSRSKYRHLWPDYDEATVEEERLDEWLEAERLDPFGLSVDPHAQWRILAAWNESRPDGEPPI
jgi:hypothetical protein